LPERRIDLAQTAGVTAAAPIDAIGGHVEAAADPARQSQNAFEGYPLGCAVSRSEFDRHGDNCSRGRLKKFYAGNRLDSAWMRAFD
jgi:hypothetical protein